MTYQRDQAIGRWIGIVLGVLWGASVVLIYGGLLVALIVVGVNLIRGTG